jgi:hypothetical protein
MEPIGLGLNTLTLEGIDYRKKPLPAIPQAPLSVTYSETQYQSRYRQQYSVDIEEVEHFTPYNPSAVNTTFLSSGHGVPDTDTNRSILTMQHNLQEAQQIIAINAVSYEDVVAAYKACWAQLLDLRKENIRLQRILAIQTEVSTL